MSRKQGLKIAVEEDQLVIRIGVDALVFAAEHSEEFQPYNAKSGNFDQWKIRDADEFAKAVANHLHDEEENGSTPVTRTLDEIFVLALEDGCKADLIKDGASEF